MIAPDAALSPAAVCYPPAPTRALPSSRRLVVSALLWMVAAALFFAMSLAITFFALGLFRVAVLHAPASPDNRTAQLIGLALAVFSIYGTFTIVSLHKARQIGNGDWRAGLGFAPIRNALRVLGFAALLLVFVSLLLTTLAVNPTLHALYTSYGKQFGKSLAGGSPAFVLLFWAVAILLAPVAEELFFRGWLWTGLRKTLTPIATSVITGVLWLACHLADGLLQPITLIPAAIILSLVRHHGASVRASIAVHFANNLFVPLAAVTVALIFH